ncbi:hypothetical protein BCR44DRAFT_1441214 [Catenaria anguillulae PL171]|uniref:Uncharacterized protein n=1 Tax=Catenaria anguillulae PL171 TaxID=765915 RepID=A0A1Y2HBR5_9FUNG|nr:hypothetical protein BCR44DRAFT_1441214 [Catenaria anguillulae PL171]
MHVTSEQLKSMANNELIEYCLGVQSALRTAKATESIKQADAAKLQNQTETTQILQDQIRHLQETVSKQQLQLQELQVFRKKSERLKALVHQQESVIQHLERFASTSSRTRLGNASIAPLPPGVAASQHDLELLMRCSKAESRVAALEKQIQELSGRIAVAKVGSGTNAAG